MNQYHSSVDEHGDEPAEKKESKTQDSFNAPMARRKFSSRELIFRKIDDLRIQAQPLSVKNSDQ